MFSNKKTFFTDIVVRLYKYNADRNAEKIYGWATIDFDYVCLAFLHLV